MVLAEMSDPRLAATLLNIVYDDLTSIANGVKGARDVLERLRGLLGEAGRDDDEQLKNLAAVVGELDIPELTEALRAVATSRQGMAEVVTQTLPISMLQDAIDYIAKRQAMIRDEGFAPDSG